MLIRDSLCVSFPHSCSLSIGFRYVHWEVIHEFFKCHQEEKMILFHKHYVSPTTVGLFPCCCTGFIKYLISSNSFAELCVSKVEKKKKKIINWGILWTTYSWGSKQIWGVTVFLPITTYFAQLDWSYGSLCSHHACYLSNIWCLWCGYS